MLKTSNPFEIIYGKGPEADIAAVKSKMIIMLMDKMRDSGLTQKEWSVKLGCSPSEVSRIKNCHVSGVSMEKLLKHLLSIGFNIESVLGVEGQKTTGMGINIK